MLVITEGQKKQIYMHLKGLSICNRCILRFLGFNVHGNKAMFLDVDDLSINLNLGIEERDQENKRTKMNPCRACLDILCNSTIEKYVSAITDDYKVYDMNEFFTILNFPNAMTLRELGMFIYLKEKFPNIYKNFHDIQNVKRVFRVISSDIFALKLKKPFSTTANLQINISILYEDEEKETRNLHKFISNKKMSKLSIAQSLSDCSDDVFKTNFAVPPTIPDKETSATATFMSTIIYVGGRYLKFSREMGQSPFIVNNIPITEHSVQEVIFESMTKILKCDPEKLVFSSSGREDADTRMLGDGRPFYIQISDPKFEKVTAEHCQAIEEAIAESNTVVVVKLQQVSLASTKSIKLGELEKRKHYRALCKSLSPNIDDVIHNINMLCDQQIIKQATPIRVLHRRTHLIREKVIFKMKASRVQGYSKLFYLDLITEAGTYVKEFVNGDFQRTNPNLCKLTGYPVDVIALDVTAVELEWP